MNLSQAIKVLTLKFVKESGLLSITIFFSKGYTEKWSKETFEIESVLKTNPWTDKIKDLNRKNDRMLFLKRNVVE